MSSSDYHILPDGEGWAVKRGNAKRASSRYPTKEQAIEAGRELAKRRNTDVVVHGRDGRIEELDGYGSDPVRSPDTVH
jgi:uncharacterized protein YdaT